MRPTDDRTPPRLASRKAANDGRGPDASPGTRRRPSAEPPSEPPSEPDPAEPLAADPAPDFAELGRAVLRIEAEAVAALEARLGEDFDAACALLLGCTGRIVVTGVGKSGHVGAKLAATFASTGSPAFFVHAGEASHGDLGMLQAGDVVVAISHSGATTEILTLVPGIERLGIPIVALTGDAGSPLGSAARVHLDVSVEREACPLGLAPTASTSAAMAMGDALAVALLKARGFDEDDFARSHPGGRLGRRLLLRVADVMAKGSGLPRVRRDARLADALVEISKKGLGMIAVTDAEERLVGVFTDGDLRRAIESGADVRTLSMSAVMTGDPRTIDSERLAVVAVGRMQEHRVTSLPVVDDGELVGVVTMHALLAAGVV